MDKKELQEIIKYIIQKTVQLKDKHVKEKDLEIDYICIFSQTHDDYKKLKKIAEKDGKIIWNSPTGPIYKYDFSLDDFHPKLLKIRVPDKTKPEIGDVDFNTDYQQFKQKHSEDPHFKLIERPEFEMLELMDPEFDVRVYFSSIPQSQILGVF